MPYSPTTWVENVTKLGPTNLNHLEQGVASSLQSGDSAGGDLSGTWPNPTIGSAKVTVAKLAAGVTLDAIAAANATAASWSNNSKSITALSAASSLTGLTIGSGTAGASGDTIFQTNSLEAARFAFPTSTTASGVNALNSATVNVASTSGFPLSGTFYLSGVAVTYTGINGNSFTGCGNHAATVGGETVTTTSGTLLFNFGDPQSAKSQYNVTTGRHVDIRHGYSATPSTGWVPTVKISRTWQHAATHVVGVNALNSATVNVADTTGFASSGVFYINGTAVTYTGKTSTSFTGCGNHAATVGGEVAADFPMSGDGAENLATLSVNATAVNSGAQSVGAFFGATNTSSRVGAKSDPSPDACGIYSVGSISGSGANGVAMAAVLIGDRESGASSGVVTVAQVFSSNNSTDSTYSPSTVSDCGFWMNAIGAGNSGAGILFTGSGGKQFDVGIGFMSDGAAGPVKTSTIRDDSSSTTSIDIRGAHGIGVDMSTATFAGAAIKVPNNVSYSALSTGGVSTALFRLNTSNLFEIRSAMQWLDSVNVALGTGAGTTLGTASNQVLKLGTALNANSNKITNLTPGTVTTDAAALANSLDQFAVPAGNVSWNSHKITSLLQPGASGNTASVGDALSWPGPLVGALKDFQFFGPGAGQTWTKPTQGTVAVVLMRGAGSGGGGGVNTASAGNARYGGYGGASGGWVAFTVPLAALASTVTVAVASGGAGGTAGNAGGDANRTTQFDTVTGLCTIPASITASTGGGAGGVSSPSASTGGTATAPVYTGYAITSTTANGTAGGASSNSAAASNGSSGSGGGGGGVTTAPAGQSGGAGTNAAASNAVSPGSAAAAGGASAVSNATAAFALTMVSLAGANTAVGGGGGGGNSNNGIGGGIGADAYNGGGGGGGGSCVNGTAGVGGKGGDGMVAVFVY